MKQPSPVTKNNGKQYWLSLRDKADSPEYRVMIEHEFPAGPPEHSNLNRRDFLALMGASIALAGLTSCRRPEEHIVPYVSRPEQVTPGIGVQYATSMPLGTDCESLLVETREGRPVSIGGNALRASTGSACTPWASASILGLYDPDRSMHCMRRGQATTTGNFVETWGAMHEEFVTNGGEGLALLLEPFASPTRSRLLKSFRDMFPKALIACYEAVSDREILDGSSLLFGTPLRPVHAYDKARVVLALDADVFGAERNAFAHARAFADGRRVQSPDDTMNRLYLVESSLTQTAALADHRLRLPAQLIPVFLAELMHTLAEKGVMIAGDILAALPRSTSIDTRWVEAVAEDLTSHRGEGIVVAGRGHTAVVHALIAILNIALENAGNTVSWTAHPHTLESDPAMLLGLVEAIRGGSVQTLIMLGGNPAFDAPADADFRGAIENVPNSMHFSMHVDETSSVSSWHLPRRHYLEAWSDVSHIEGHLGVIQPLIAPLYEDGFSDVEMMTLLVSGTPEKSLDTVRSTWNDLLPGLNDETWRRILHDGLHSVKVTTDVPSPNIASIAAAIDVRTFSPQPPGPKNVELVFRPSPTVYDGRFANNAWLQEFPDPVTKLTWDNAALISPATAEVLNLKDGDLLRLECNNGETPMPVWIMPGQADYSVTVLLGYGRHKAGRVGSGVGFNAYRLRSSTAMYTSAGLRIGPAFGKHHLACVQDHHGLDTERMARQGVRERLPQIYREATLDEFRKNPEFASEVVHMPKLRSLWKDYEYDTGLQWGMSIDLNACIGCGACTIACQSENNIPVVGKKQVLNGREMHWIRVDRYFSGDVDDPAVRVMPIACHHCETAPCEQVCPVAATTHDEEGLNVMTYNRCIGTRYCSNNCPYKVRRFNFYNYTSDMAEILKMAQNPDVTVRFRGVMEKCTYCTQRIDRGKHTAKLEDREVADGDIRSACQNACPTRAIVFGDINDEASAVAREKASTRNYALLGEYNLRPRTTFRARLRNPNPLLEPPTST